MSELGAEKPLAISDGRVASAQLEWLVPGLVLGLPGMLLLGIVAAQVVAAAAFLGLTQRTLGASEATGSAKK